MNSIRYATLYALGALAAFCVIALMYATVPPFLGFIVIPVAMLLMPTLAAWILEPAPANPRLLDGDTRVLTPGAREAGNCAEAA